MVALIKTKNKKPMIPPQLIQRERLFHYLDQVLDVPLSLVLAPAGYGKTTLVVDWLNTRPEVCGWYAVDRLDNDLNRFLSYLISSIQPHLPGDVLDLLVLLHTPQPVDPKTVLTIWIQALENMNQPVIIVLDDYHLIETVLIHQALNFLVDNLPHNVHLLICSREEPPLPVAKLRARRQLLEIRTDQLRFNERETNQFMALIAEQQLTEEIKTFLFRQTEGWVTGLQLAAKTLNEYSEPHLMMTNFSGENHFVLDYLVDEVLSQCSVEKRAFLYQTAVLQCLTPAVCDAVLNQQNSREMLLNLYHENLFLISLDSRLKEFRYHHLFADLLKVRAKEADPVLYQINHQRAANWFLNNEDIELGLYHALQANDWPLYINLVKDHGLGYLYRGEVGILQNWLKQIPDLKLNQDAWLLTLQSWVYLLKGEANSCQKNLTKIQLIVSNQEPHQALNLILGHVNAILSYLYAFQQNVSLSYHHADLALKYLPEESFAIRSIVSFTKAANAMMSADFDGAMEAFHQAGQWGHEDNPHIAVPAMGALGGLLIQKGQLLEAKKVYETILSWTKRTDGSFSPLASRGFNGRVDIYLEQLEKDKALEAALTSVALAKKWHIPDAQVGAYIHLAEVYLALNQLDAAATILNRCQDILLSARLSPGFEEYIQQLTIQRLLRINYNAAVQHALTAAGQIVFPIQLLQVGLWLACIQVFQHRSDLYLRAKEMSDQLESFAKKHGFIGIQLQVGIIQVVNQSLIGSGDRANLLSELSNLGYLAEQYGFKASLLTPGEALVRLLKSFSFHELPLYWQNLTTTAGYELSAQRLMDPLSTREHEILTLVSLGKTNQEISESLVIAVSTVKSHTNKIYAKLGVKNRTQALAKARGLGLIP